jgi:DUF2075 family protein
MSYYDQKIKEMQNLIYTIDKEKQELEKILKRVDQRSKELEEDKNNIIQMAKERQIGFPVLAKAYNDYFELQDKNIVSFLKYKKHPAVSASEVVKEFGGLRREAVKDKKMAEYLLEYYETICPFLLDLKEEVMDVTESERERLKDYTEEELQDEVTKYLTKEEYRKLSSVERNQMALDRYWKRPKSKWHIGRCYERYVGYLYEMQDYDVDYIGIFKGFEDLGRDLICKKGNEHIVIQCKYWSKFKTIYERHIFQFFGTVFKYRDDNPGKTIRGLFYATTTLSELARRFAKELNIGIEEKFPFDKNYPSIKCNISRIDGTKIYHLPFDQQYDTTKIEKNRNEFYCQTVKEAEDRGFRRAFRYKGLRKL